MKHPLLVVLITLTAFTIVLGKPYVKKENERTADAVKEQLANQRSAAKFSLKPELPPLKRIPGFRSQRTYQILYGTNELSIWIIVTRLVTGHFTSAMRIDNIPPSFPHAGILAEDNHGSNSWNSVRWYTQNDPGRTNDTDHIYAQPTNYESYRAAFTAEVATNDLERVHLLIRAAETNEVVGGSLRYRIENISVDIE